MNLRGKIDFAEMTDTGRVRDHNEDAIGSDPEIGLMAPKDFVGGQSLSRPLRTLSDVVQSKAKSLPQEGLLRFP